MYGIEIRKDKINKNASGRQRNEREKNYSKIHEVKVRLAALSLYTESLYKFWERYIFALIRWESIVKHREGRVHAKRVETYFCNACGLS